jgi:hypothetical protein
MQGRNSEAPVASPTVRAGGVPGLALIPFLPAARPGGACLKRVGDPAGLWLSGV